MTYRFVQGIDYGPRKGTLGLEFHMSEGGDELPGYLAQHFGETVTEWHTRIRGVSCHIALLTTGEPVQMVDFDNASGNVNPADRSTDKGYYGHSTLVDVLGDHWTDPNAWSISMEIAGHAATGPNAAQVKAAIAWANDMKARYPSLRGAWGHADQTDTKGCPGLTDNMKAIFAGLGGHGLWEANDVRFVKAIDGKLLPVSADEPWLYADGSPGGTFSKATDVKVIGTLDAHSGQYLVRIGTGIPYTDGITRPTDVLIRSTRALIDAPVPAPDPAAIAAAVNAALDHVAAAHLVEGTAIDEARIRV